MPLPSTPGGLLPCPSQRCKAKIQGYTCGHSCHINCALRSYMAGTFGGSINLDAEYYCCRCDLRTDLISHIGRLLEGCDSTDSLDDIRKIFNRGICVLHGSKRTSVKQLLHHIELAMSKLKNGTHNKIFGRGRCIFRHLSLPPTYFIELCNEPLSGGVLLRIA